MDFEQADGKSIRRCEIIKGKECRNVMDIIDGKSKRNSRMDVIKGIGIFSIVIGHAGWIIPIGAWQVPVGPFVYSYHLAVFFFCSGYLFRETEQDIGNYISRKLKSLYVPFVGYSLLYLLCRNLFLTAGIIEGSAYEGGEWLIRFTDVITFNSLNELLSAFWFVPVLFFTMCVFALLYIVSGKLPASAAAVFQWACGILAGVAGLYAVGHRYGLLFNMQVVYLMLPIAAGGFIYRKYEDRCRRAVNGIGLILSFGILCGVLSCNVGIIELSRFEILNVWLFYPVTAAGIWFCLCLGKLLCKGAGSRKLFSYIGRNSFDIMALHFFGFKAVDYAVCHMTGRMEELSAFPHSFDQLWLIYYAAGIGVPLFIKELYIRGKLAVKRGLNHEMEKREK